MTLTLNNNNRRKTEMEKNIDSVHAAGNQYNLRKIWPVFKMFSVSIDAHLIDESQ